MQLHAYTYSSKFPNVSCVVGTPVQVWVCFYQLQFYKLGTGSPKQEVAVTVTYSIQYMSYAQALYIHLPSFYPCLQHLLHLHTQNYTYIFRRHHWWHSWIGPRFPDWTLQGPFEPSQYITICTTCLPVLMVVISSTIFVLKHQLSTWPTQHIMVQKFPNVSCFVRDISPSLGLFLMSSLTLVLNSQMKSLVMVMYMILYLSNTQGIIKRGERQ